MTTEPAVGTTYYYPNKLARIVLVAMRTVMGPEQYALVLDTAGLPQYRDRLPPNNMDKAFAFEWVSALQQATEVVYGEKTGRSLNRRVGRACLDHGLKDVGPVLGISDLPFRLMPLNVKFQLGLDAFALLFNKFTDQRVRLSEDSESKLWIIDRNPVCWGRETSEPCCHLALGILEEAVFWGTGGVRYNVEETECIAAGAASCVFRISKQPDE